MTDFSSYFSSSSSIAENGVSPSAAAFLGRPLFFFGADEVDAVSLLDRPRFRGRLVPGGADKFTVQ
jgi:hypothetical protein